MFSMALVHGLGVLRRLVLLVGSKQSELLMLANQDSALLPVPKTFRSGFRSLPYLSLPDPCSSSGLTLKRQIALCQILFHYYSHNPGPEQQRGYRYGITTITSTFRLPLERLMQGVLGTSISFALPLLSHILTPPPKILYRELNTRKMLSYPDRTLWEKEKDIASWVLTEEIQPKDQSQSPNQHVYVLNTGALRRILLPRICTARPTAIRTLGAGGSSFAPVLAEGGCDKLCWLPPWPREGSRFPSEAGVGEGFFVPPNPNMLRFLSADSLGGWPAC